MNAAAQLLAVHDTLGPEERYRFAREVAEGHGLARVVGALIAAARRLPAAPSTEPDGPLLKRDSRTDMTSTPYAWLLYSRRLDCELWLVRDDTARALLSDSDTRGRAVVLGHELEHFAGLDHQGLKLLLDTKTSLGVTITDVVDGTGEGLL